jgi:hypothetical protein
MTRVPATIGLLAVLLAPAAASAQDQPEDRRPAAQIQDSIRIAAHARQLVAGAVTDSARAARLYDWIAHELVYDVRGYLTGRTGDMKPESVWKRRSAVCEGYVQLFHRMAMEAGLQTEIVTGYAKGFDYEPGQRIRDANHAWLALWLGDEWRLIDPTWGAGLVVNGAFQPQFTRAYFLTPPDVLQLSHLPDDTRWQLAAQPLSRREFERMPAVPRLLVDAGFAPIDLRAAGLATGAPGYPLVGSIDGGVRVVRAPAEGVLADAAPVRFEVVWPGARDVSVVSGGAWTALDQEGQLFRGDAVADGDVVQLVGKRQGSEEYETLLHYRVQ